VPTDRQQASAVLEVARLVLDDACSPPFDEADDIDPWPCLGAALLCPLIYAALGDTLRSEDRAVLARLGDVLAEPAASVCRELAEAVGDAA